MVFKARAQDSGEGQEGFPSPNNYLHYPIIQEEMTAGSGKPRLCLDSAAGRPPLV